jgi:hypothetical protein
MYRNNSSWPDLNHLHYTVIVTNADTQSGSAVSAYTFVAAPTVVSVSPLVGSINGLTPVTIAGTGFTVGALVDFGGAACTGITVVNSTTINCTTSAHAAGAVTITVTNTDTQSGTKAAGFTYQTMAVLAWQVGATSPNPPNPDSYGTTAVNVTHTYTLKNTGDTVTTAITISKLGGSPGAWLFGTDNCTGFTLASNATCTIQVTFLGQFLSTGPYTTTLNATAATGGTSTNTMTGSEP